MMGYYPNSWHASMFSIQGRKEASVLSRSRKEIDFTQSLDMSLQNEQTVPSRARASDFTQSVAVVPSTSDGKYSVYTGVHDNVSDSKNTTDTVNSESWFLSSMRYGHNIGNPDRRYQRSAEKSESIKAARKQSIGGKMKSSGSKSTFGSKLSIDRLSQLSETKTQEQCKCNGLYHSHTFDEEDSFGRSMKMEKKFIPRRKSSEVWQANDHQSLICNIFWRAEMSFSGYKHGDKVVNFKELWPKSNKIDTTLVDSICVEGTGLRDSLWELILLLVTGGPVWVLKSLIDLKFIGKDYQYNGDCTLLHLACVLQNIEVTQLCIQYGLSSNVQDKSGQTAFEVTKCSRIRKQTQNTSTKIQASFSSNKSRNITLYKPTQRDVDELFRLAENPKCVYEFQKKIQTYELNINQLKKDGDLLVHVAARSGLGHLPFLMSIIQIQKADINLYNNDGMTPLMISAQDGNDTMCETMMCLFGADPNLQNIKTKKTALHYAVTNGYINVINCLIKRGADFNLEDDDMCRPDDVFMEVSDAGDCREAVLSQREQRMENLKEKIINGTVYIEDVRATDLSVVDHDDYTPVMIAAIHNRPENLNTLLTVSKATINAQHSNTGLTALAMAAKNGHAECCRVLFKHGVNAGIADIKIYLPLHYAVLNNHEYVVDAFREHFPDSYIGLHKALNLCRRSSIHDKLTDAFSVRQEKIISPQLRISSMEGNAEKLYCLLEEGDDVNMKSDLNGLPAVFIAVEFGHVEVVKLLIEKGADLTKRDPRTGNTVLHVAASNGQLTTVEYLLQFCKNTTRKHRNKLDVNSMNNDKRTALQFACEKGYNKIIKLLLDNGATTALLNSQGTLFTTAEYEGARSLIEGRRNEHTNVIFKLVSEKSKKALPALMQVWMPRFDHNLRDKLGDTPLMVACSKGLLETVKFLLQSAVYANQVSQEEVDNSDTDSGVTDLPPWRSYPAESKYHDELSKSMEGLLDHDHTSVVPSYDATRTSLNPGNFLNSLPGPLYGESSKMNSYLTDIERPKGLYIYHDSIVSHVCAVNLFDGNTPLHRTIQGGDNVVMATIIIEADSAVINMQNDAGFTPVHLACKLKRKKILRKLLAIKGVDLSLLTLNGELPEEVTSNKTLQRMVKMARDGQPDSPRTAHSETMTQHSSSAQSFTESLPSVISQGGASTINFDKIHDLYTSLRTAKYQSEK